MALIDIGDGWERELLTAEKLHQHVLSQIGERSKLSRKSSVYHQLTDDLGRTLSQLSGQLNLLREKLHTESSKLTQGERNRREGVLDNFSRKEKQLKELVSRTIFTEVNSDRKTLFRKPVPGSGIADMGTTGWGDSSSPPGDGGAESLETAGMSAQSLKEKQQEAMLDQDAGLDALHSVIIRQKNMAQQIGVEIIQQNDIIDEIGQFHFYVAFI
ncbi:syntaxin-8 [Eurytemora carolleeae]|uniref:syntaxin-8 n=1 Tax=Eurytemora carolleeae TaxID=1294199 RepID=UPI000C790EEE|nr:syntaxin-8 [Eurytemora carolleeae]|eukprot:XP_023333685.1 syntaxin-8-like [Eurytemora affinis]